MGRILLTGPPVILHQPAHHSLHPYWPLFYTQPWNDLVEIFLEKKKGKKENWNERLYKIESVNIWMWTRDADYGGMCPRFLNTLDGFFSFMEFTAIALVLMREAETRVFASFSLRAAVALKAAMIDFPPFSPAHVVQQSGPPSRAIDPYWSPRAQRAPAHGEAREPHRNDWHQEAERGNEREGASLALNSKRNRQKNRSFIWYIIARVLYRFCRSISLQKRSVRRQIN